MNDLISAASYRQSIALQIEKNFAPWSKMAPEEWAEQIYRLPNGARFKWDYAPYSKAMFLSLFDRSTIETSFMLYSRGMKSTVVLLAIGYSIDQQPRRILSLWPTNSNGEKWSKDCFVGELADTTPCLHYLGSQSKKRTGDLTMLHKKFPGGLIDIFGANAPGDMRRAKGSLLYADEIDAIEEIESDEGDQLIIFAKRGDEYPDTIRVYASYPGLCVLDSNGKPAKGHSRIDSKMRQSDGNQWFSTCVLCGGEPFVMHRSMLRYEEDKTETARLECPRCKGLLDDSQRYAMAHKQGFNNWKPQREFRGRRGFHANAMLWPHPTDPVKCPGGALQMIADQEMAAKRSDNPQRSLRVVVNTVDAEPFNPDTKDETPPDWTAIYNRREDYATDTKILMPEGALVLVAGVDVQPDRLEVHKGCYGRKQEYWGVEHVVIPGDIKRSETWEALEQELLRTYDSAIAPNAKLALSFALVDAGHGADHLLWWLAALQKKGSPLCGRVRACRGSSQYPHPVVDNRYSKIVKQLHGHWVGGDEAKSLIYTRLRMEEKEEGYRHYGMNHDEKFFQQLTVEKATVEFKKGEEHRRFRNEEHARNEALDCSVYEMAAFRLRQWNFDALEAKMREELEPRPSEPAQIKQATRVSFIPQTAGAWI